MLANLTSTQWSSRGNPVRLIDLKASALESALRDIAKLKSNAAQASSHEDGPIKTFSADDMSTALRDAWLVVEVSYLHELLTEDLSKYVEKYIETYQTSTDDKFYLKNVPEALPAKRAIVKQLDELANPTTIIASNSSSFTISEIIDKLELLHPQRCVNLHSCKTVHSIP